MIYNKLSLATGSPAAEFHIPCALKAAAVPVLLARGSSVVKADIAAVLWENLHGNVA